MDFRGAKNLVMPLTSPITFIILPDGTTTASAWIRSKWTIRPSAIPVQIRASQLIWFASPNFKNMLTIDGSAIQPADGLVLTLTVPTDGELQMRHSGVVKANQVTISEGATFAGEGGIVAAVVNSGRVAPDATAASLSISGSYSQGATGSLDITIGPGAAGRLAVTGPTTLAGALNLIFTDPGSLAVGDSWTLITSTGEIPGGFDVVSGADPTVINSLNAALVVLYHANDVSLRVSIQGDANGDNSVDQLDLNSIIFNWQGAGAGLTGGDFNGDGLVDQLDLNTLIGNWQAASPADLDTLTGLASVPEPASLLAQLAATPLLMARGPRRRVS